MSALQKKLGTTVACRDPTASEAAPAPKLPASPSSRAPRPVLARSEPRVSTTQLSPSPSENAFFGDSAAVLSNTERALPTSQLTDNETVDVALRQNLRTRQLQEEFNAAAALAAKLRR